MQTKNSVEKLEPMVHRKVRGGKFKIKFEPKPPPVEVGQELDVTIIELAPSGDGLSKIRGYTIIVPKAKPRDCVTIKITQVGEKEAVGQIVQ
jgi:predicted RNA-binding protein with TRAM domain